MQSFYHSCRAGELLGLDLDVPERGGRACLESALSGSQTGRRRPSREVSTLRITPGQSTMRWRYARAQASLRGRRSPGYPTKFKDGSAPRPPIERPRSRIGDERRSTDLRNAIDRQRRRDAGRAKGAGASGSPGGAAFADPMASRTAALRPSRRRSPCAGGRRSAPDRPERTEFGDRHDAYSEHRSAPSTAVAHAAHAVQRPGAACDVARIEGRRVAGGRAPRGRRTTADRSLSQCRRPACRSSRADSRELLRWTHRQCVVTAWHASIAPMICEAHRRGCGRRASRSGGVPIAAMQRAVTAA